MILRGQGIRQAAECALGGSPAGIHDVELLEARPGQRACNRRVPGLLRGLRCHVRSSHAPKGPGLFTRGNEPPHKRDH